VVFLEETEASVVRRHLPLADEGRLPQPCPAHRANGCSIYEERPSGCRAFRCSLYRSHEQGRGSLEPKLRRVARIRELAARLVDCVPAPRGRPSLRERLADLDTSPHGLASLDPGVALDLVELATYMRRDLDGLAQLRDEDLR
jgi:hypothetical protein